MEPLRHAALCLTHRPLLASGYRPSREPHNVAFAPGGDAVRLRLGTGLGRVDLSVRIRYRLVEPPPAVSRGWGIETISYLYAILDREGREILAYHWHPFARGPGFPHLHLSGRIGVLPIGGQAPPVALGGMHLPTEEITFPAIVRLLLAEFDAAPRRQNWAAVVAAGDAAGRAQRAGPS
jgi:hypothetical protein